MEGDQVNRANTIKKNVVGTATTTAEEMDEKRRNTAILDYLCKLDEARAWVAKYTGKETDLADFLKELPKGEWLAMIAQHFNPEIRSSIHIAPKHEYKYTDNINMFLDWLRKIRLSRHFLFEVIDLYESKNIPNVIYCIHGLAHFLSKRGVSKGIQRRRTRAFTEEDRALIKDDILSIQSKCYDDILDNMDSDEYNRSEDRTAESAQNENITCEYGSFTSDKKSSNSNNDALNGLASDSPVGEAVPSTTVLSDRSSKECIASFLETMLWSCAFKDMLHSRSVSIPSLRRFIAIKKPSSVVERNMRELQRAQAEIVAKFKSNHQMHSEKEQILRTVRLLVENQARLRGIPVRSSPLLNDYRLFKRVLYNLLHDHSLLFKIISSGSDLPLRVLYPDNTIGDYHFSKFVEYVRNVYSRSADSQELIRKLSRHHFISSHVFAQLTELFNDASREFDLNPVTIAKAQDPSRHILLDDAIKDKGVRAEILRRAAQLIEYLSVRLDYISEMTLPYYVRMFAGTPKFFEDFIEPAILLSKNFIISELVRYVFYSKDLFETRTMSFEQERLYYYDCKYDKTQDFDFTDYSPLRDFLNSEKNRNFAQTFLEKNRVTASVGEYFLNTVSDGRSLEIELCLNEVNSIIIVLKQNIGIMNPTMSKLVGNLDLLRVRPIDYYNMMRNTEHNDDKNRDDSGGLPENINEKFNSILPEDNSKDNPSNSDISLSYDKAPVVIDGIEQLAPPEVVIKPIDIAKRLPLGECTPESPEYFEERFVLQLDTQFVDLAGENVFSLESMLHDLRSRLILLISYSSSDSLSGVLHTTTPEDLARYSKLSSQLEPLESLKRRVEEDLTFLVEKGIISSTDGYRSLLAMVAQDVLKCRFEQAVDEITLNTETLDALYKKESLLKEELKHLYSYTKDLFETMSVNRSGIFFNRQIEPRSRYGTYRYPLNILRPVLFENVNLSKASVVISMDLPLVFSLEISCAGGVLSRMERIGFDELLRLREDGITSFDFNGICALNVGELVNIVNEQYINK